MPITQHERDDVIALLTKLEIRFVHGFKNYSGNSTNSQALVVYLQNLSTLQSLLQKIQALNNEKLPQQRILLRVAAGGKGTTYSHSYSVNGVKDADIVLRLVGDEFLIKQIHEDAVTVGPNVQFTEIESLLAAKGLALPTMPLNPYLTLVGLASIGGVGTGRDQPSFSGLLKKVKLCLYSGMIAELNDRSPDFKCLFATNAGLFGIIIEATFRCSKQVQFQLIETPVTITALKHRIASGLFDETPYTSVFIVPDVIAETETNSARIYQWKPTEQLSDRMIWMQIHHLLQAFLVFMIEFLKIAQLLNYSYFLSLAFMRYVVKPVTIGTKNKIQHGPAHILFHHQKAYAQAGLEDVGWAIPDDGSGNQVLRALEIILDYIKREMSAPHHRCLITTGGIYIRYITGTKDGISMCNNPTGMNYIGLIDVVSNINAPGFIQFQQRITSALQRLGAKPHFGKYLPDDYKIEKSYSMTFLDAFNRFHETHNLDPHRNPFLTKHFCHVLDLQAYMPEDQKQENDTCPAHSWFGFLAPKIIIQSLVGDSSLVNQ